MENQWYIGQEIVCIKTHSNSLVIEGRTYTVASLMQGCCEVKIDVGIPRTISCIRCPPCNAHYGYNDGIRWLSERLFAPLEYDSQAISELISNKVPSLPQEQ